MADFYFTYLWYAALEEYRYIYPYYHGYHVY